MVWTDPETGTAWEFEYIVTQTEAEGPEYMLFRKADTETGRRGTWHDWPMFVEPPPEVMEYFFGPATQAVVTVRLNKTQIGNCISFLSEDANGVTELREVLIEAGARLRS